MGLQWHIFFKSLIKTIKMCHHQFGYSLWKILEQISVVSALSDLVAYLHIVLKDIRHIRFKKNEFVLFVYKHYGLKHKCDHIYYRFFRRVGSTWSSGTQGYTSIRNQPNHQGNDVYFHILSSVMWKYILNFSGQSLVYLFILDHCLEIHCKWPLFYTQQLKICEWVYKAVCYCVL